MFQEFNTEALLAASLLLQLAGLAFVVLIDPYITKRYKRILLVAVALIFALLMQNQIEYTAAVNARIFERTLASIAGYCIRPVIIVLFLYLVSPERDYRPAWILVMINAAVHMTALFSHICFWFDENNHFHAGPLRHFSFIVSGILIGYFFYLTVTGYGGIRRKETWIPIFNMLVIIAAVAADYMSDSHLSRISFLTASLISCGVFFYIWLHLQYVRAHENSLVAEQKIQIMMSQIQPHFLYNTLSTIQALCRIDPEKAFYTTEKFGTYLRQNIDSLSRTDLIPVEKELEHTRIYAEIETIRFPSLRVEYETPDTEFFVPALTIQPLVENAIRHGVRIRKDGVVSVVTRKIPEGHEIVITDNGKGFDAEKAVRSDESHIGLRNVRERLESMCGGTMEIHSVIGEGTTITIRIPEQKANKPDGSGDKRQ